MRMNFRALDEWERKRVRLCHDRLRNQFAVGLGKLAKVVEGSVNDPRATENAAIYLERWPECRDDLRALIEASTNVLSPSRFFTKGVFSTLDSDTQQFLSEAAERSWRRLSRPDEVADHALITLLRAGECLETLGAGLASPGSNLSLPASELALLIAQARKALTEVTNAMANLARCIKF